MNKVERMDGKTAWGMNKNTHIHGGYRAGSGQVQIQFISRFIGYIINSIPIGYTMFNNRSLAA